MDTGAGLETMVNIRALLLHEVRKVHVLRIKRVFRAAELKDAGFWPIACVDCVRQVLQVVGTALILVKRTKGVDEVPVNLRASGNH